MLPLDFASLAVPKLGLASFRGRFILRGVFLLLIVATLSLALKLLAEEKQRSHLSYAQSIKKTQSEIIAKLRTDQRLGTRTIDKKVGRDLRAVSENDCLNEAVGTAKLRSGDFTPPLLRAQM